MSLNVTSELPVCGFIIKQVTVLSDVDGFGHTYIFKPSFVHFLTYLHHSSLPLETHSDENAVFMSLWNISVDG